MVETTIPLNSYKTRSYEFGGLIDTRASVVISSWAIAVHDRKTVPHGVQMDVSCEHDWVSIMLSFMLSLHC
jgi:hypothetical protein